MKSFVKVKNLETSEYLEVNLELATFVRLINAPEGDPQEGCGVISFGPNNFFMMDKESTEKVSKIIDLHRHLVPGP